MLVSAIDEGNVMTEAVTHFGELEPQDIALVLARAKCEAVTNLLDGDSCPDGAPTGALVLGCDSLSLIHI